MEPIKIGHWTEQGERAVTFGDVLDGSVFTTQLGISNKKAKGEFARLREYADKNPAIRQVQLPENYQQWVKNKEYSKIEAQFQEDLGKGTLFGLNLHTVRDAINDGRVQKVVPHKSGETQRKGFDGAADEQDINPYTHKPRTWGRLIDVAINPDGSEEEKQAYLAAVDMLDKFESTDYGKAKLSTMETALGYYKETQGIDFGKYQFTVTGDGPNMSAEMSPEGHRILINSNFLEPLYILNEAGEFVKVDTTSMPIQGVLMHESGHGVDQNVIDEYIHSYELEQTHPAELAELSSYQMILSAYLYDQEPQQMTDFEKALWEKRKDIDFFKEIDALREKLGLQDAGKNWYQQEAYAIAEENKVFPSHMRRANNAYWLMFGEVDLVSIDLNQDGKIDLEELATLRKTFEEKEADAKYNSYLPGGYPYDPRFYQDAMAALDLIEKNLMKEKGLDHSVKLPKGPFKVFEQEADDGPAPNNPVVPKGSEGSVLVQVDGLEHGGTRNPSGNGTGGAGTVGGGPKPNTDSPPVNGPGSGADPGPGVGPGQGAPKGGSGGTPEIQQEIPENEEEEGKGPGRIGGADHEPSKLPGRTASPDEGMDPKLRQLIASSPAVESAVTQMRNGFLSEPQERIVKASTQVSGRTV